MADASGTVLVTGANGFIGSHLVEALLEKGYRVRCLVRPTSDRTFIQHLPVTWAVADVREPASLAEACQGIDGVCHCAALTRALDRETFMRTNAEGTRALAQACLALDPPVRRFLFLSSQAAAGPSQAADRPVDELSAPRPVTWYGDSKLAAERLLQAMAGQLPLTIIRAAAVFGPRDRDFLTYFRLVRRGWSLQLGRAERRISLIYVRDLVRLLLLALESEQASGRLYFASNGDLSYGEFSAAIADALGCRARRVVLPEAALAPISLYARIEGRLTGHPGLLNEQRVLDLRQRYWLCSSQRACAELGFSPQVDLQAAVDETAGWYQANGWL
jgi:dihydroflavonol-4-reductase